MRRSLRYMALGVLTASLLSGNALTALADQDVNHGPGVSQAPEVSQEAPGVSGDTTQDGPGIIVEPGNGTGGQESSQSETASPETETPAPEAGTSQWKSAGPERNPICILRPALGTVLQLDEPKAARQTDCSPAISGYGRCLVSAVRAP